MTVSEPNKEDGQDRGVFDNLTAIQAKVQQNLTGQETDPLCESIGKPDGKLRF